MRLLLIIATIIATRSLGLKSRPLAPAEDMRSMGSVRLLLLYPSFVELDVFHAFATFDKVAVDRM